jgi:sugar phosphate isomerase/epimerase
MELKLSIPNFAFPLLSWEKSASLIRDLEVNAVDVGIFASASNLSPEDVLTNPSHAARRVSAALQENRLELADVFGILGRSFDEKALNHFDPEQRKSAAEFFSKLLEFAAGCGAKHLTLLPGVQFAGGNFDDDLQRAAAELLWRQEAASKLGIVLAVEPHIDSVVATPERAKRLIDLVPGLTLTVDYSHFAAQGIPHEEVEPLFVLASHFHLRCAGKGKLQTNLIGNRTEFSRVLNSIAKVDYGGYISVEYIWTDWMRCNEVDNVSEIIQLRDLLRAEAAQCNPNRSMT